MRKTSDIKICEVCYSLSLQYGPGIGHMDMVAHYSLLDAGILSEQGVHSDFMELL